ncbi:Eukaryotic translation initiation factor 2A [Zancudomyces culisetae]|uniref:Eukaryotic translation initiation factor 2A n=1 Tax=Zancudomyces culisetae TaxID=1213189 RepID=A0A1R1PHX5_ZANCU|nr:Eukaryotic translation initiation factor 2A [Zancudomyces culisetae]|eukprot:OMH80581.1 Eukaryotic translation initiation factor 2A [Zancudomyces culisetae]
MTWEKYIKSVDDKNTHKNLKVYRTADGELLGEFTQRFYKDWALQWTDDESYMARMVTNTIQFYKPVKDIGCKGADMQLHVEGVKAYSLSKGKNCAVAVFVPERKGAPALVRLFSMGNFSVPVASKSFYKADSIDFIWHKIDNSLLVMTHTEVDSTGKSYYGETSLYYLTATGNYDCKVMLDKEGPVHDVAWNPASKEFIVVYGYMPAKVALFNNRAEEKHTFGIEKYNYVRFNPQGRILALAGLGNLSGKVVLIDMKTKKTIVTLDAHGCSVLAWSPCGRYLLGATLSPKLRVDNGFKIWHYSGTLVQSREISELYDVQWMPADASLYPQPAALDRIPSNISTMISESFTPTHTSASSTPKPTGAYRPPHARNRDAQGSSPAISTKPLVPGAPPPKSSKKPLSAANTPVRSVPGAPPSSSKKSKPPKPSQSTSNGTQSPPSSRPPSNSHDHTNSRANKPAKKAGDDASPAAQQSHAASDTVKKALALKKKLRQIDALEKRRASGETLDPLQVAKLDSKAGLIAELESLGFSKK